LSQTAGDLVVDTTNNIVYIGKLDSVSGNTNLIFRNRLAGVKSKWSNAGAGSIWFGDFVNGYGLGIQQNAITTETTLPGNALFHVNKGTLGGVVASFINGNVLIGITTDTGERLQVSGSTRLLGNTVITGSLTVATGSRVELFVTNTGVTIGNIITDTHTVTGSLNISGSVTATNFTGSLFGTSSWATNALTSSFANSVFDIGIAEFNSTSSTTTAGTTAISSIATGSFTSAFYNYTISSGSNARAGQVMSVWSGSTVRYTEVTTTDIGNTATASFAVAISGPNVRLNFTAPGVWTVKSIANLL
jgi:hypothetical protein